MRGWASSSCWRGCGSDSRRRGPRVRLGSGDDAAVTVPGGATATSVDALVEGVHFSRETATLRQIGAQGPRRRRSPTWPRWAPSRARPTSSSACPPTSTRTAVSRLLDGMLELASATGTTLAGGDVTRGPVLTFACTVVGHASTPGLFVHARRRPARRRAGADRRARAARRRACCSLERPRSPTAVCPRRSPRACAAASSSRPRGWPPAAPWPPAGRGR